MTVFFVYPMTFIDWSDAEGMFGLLVDFVADERADCQEDPERCRFLADLLARLQAMEAEFPRLPESIALRRLGDLRESADPEFIGDPVMVHLEDLLEELEKLEKGGSTA